MVESHLSADATRQLAAEELVEVLKDCVREVFVSMLFSFDDADAAQLAGDAVPAALPTNAIGEESGSLDQMMIELAEVYDEEVQAGVKRALAMLEPALILVMGGSIAIIIIAILSGILSVNDLAF